MMTRQGSGRFRRLLIDLEARIAGVRKLSFAAGNKLKSLVSDENTNVSLPTHDYILLLQDREERLLEIEADYEECASAIESVTNDLTAASYVADGAPAPLKAKITPLLDRAHQIIEVLGAETDAMRRTVTAARRALVQVMDTYV